MGELADGDEMKGAYYNENEPYAVEWLKNLS